MRQRLEQQTATCESYEAQLQRVQEQMLEELDEKDQELSRLREECSKAKTGVVRERRAKEELRRKMDDVCKQFKAEVSWSTLCVAPYQLWVRSGREFSVRNADRAGETEDTARPVHSEQARGSA